MYENFSNLPDQARLSIEERVRAASRARAAREADRPARRRHRLAQQLRSVADRLDV